MTSEAAQPEPEPGEAVAGESATPSEGPAPEPEDSARPEPGDDAATPEPGDDAATPEPGDDAATPEPGDVEPEPVAVEPEPVAVEPEPVAVEPEPVRVSGFGFFTERPDVTQAVCVDRDVRRINLTALRPVAAAHPYPLLFSSVYGSHLFGFPSADSDVDLHGVHLLPAVQVVGLRHGPQTVERSWLHDEVRLDLVTFDIGKFLRLMLRRNGSVLEQLLSPLVVTSGPVHEELVALAGGCLTRQHAHHYRQGAQAQYEQYQQSGQLKPLLYTFRELLTGIHLIRTGELIAQLPTLLELVPGVPGYLGDLIELKATGGYEDGPVLPERVGDDVVTLQAELDLAEDDSPLPDHPGSEGALHDLLVRLRLEGPSAYLG